jgi:hypothetical protein
MTIKQTENKYNSQSFQFQIVYCQLKGPIFLILRNNLITKK